MAIKQVALVKLFVSNQDEALEFYTTELGFEVAKDSTLVQLAARGARGLGGGGARSELLARAAQGRVTGSAVHGRRLQMWVCLDLGFGEPLGDPSLLGEQHGLVRVVW